MNRLSQPARFSSLSFLLFLFLSVSAFAVSPDFYQIQVFRLNGKSQEQKVDNFLKAAYLPALHRAGIQKVGVFKPIESDTTSGKRIYLWIPFKSLDHFTKIQDKLAKDEVFQADGIYFICAPFDQAPYNRKESILLKAFTNAPNFFTPAFTTTPSQRIYELRSYESPTENLFRKKVKMK